MASTDPILSALRKLEDNVTERLTARIDELRDEMNGRFDAIEKRLERLEIEYQMIVSGLKRIEEQIENDGADRSRLRAEVGQLRAKVVDLDTRIREVEARLADE